MKTLVRLSLVLLSSTAALLAHPGHSAFDPRFTPHTGHAWEYAGVAGVIGLWLAAIVRALVKRRR